MDKSPSATRQPKQARAIRTRERILDRAEQAFAAKGFEAASLTGDILEPAGISVGSFYHQFADKRAVLYAILDEHRSWKEASDAVQAATGREATFAATVRQAMTELLDDIDRHPDMWWIHFREMHSADPDIRSLIEQSWAGWNESMAAVFERWTDGAATGRTVFATSGLTGVLRRYLDGDATTRRTVRGMLDEVVDACVASFTV